jgi:hypothetical protein
MLELHELPTKEQMIGLLGELQRILHELPSLPGLPSSRRHMVVGRFNVIPLKRVLRSLTTNFMRNKAEDILAVRPVLSKIVHVEMNTYAEIQHQMNAYLAKMAENPKNLRRHPDYIPLCRQLMFPFFSNWIGEKPLRSKVAKATPLRGSKFAV